MGFEPFSLWTCIGTGVVGAVVELLMQAVFSPIGYKMCKSWKEEGVGQEYIKKYVTEV